MSLDSKMKTYTLDFIPLTSFLTQVSVCDSWWLLIMNLSDVFYSGFQSKRISGIKLFCARHILWILFFTYTSLSLFCYYKLPCFNIASLEKYHLCFLLGIMLLSSSCLFSLDTNKKIPITTQICLIHHLNYLLDDI